MLREIITVVGATVVGAIGACQTIPKCDVAHELMSSTYDEKTWWVVIVKESHSRGLSCWETFRLRAGWRQAASWRITTACLS